MLTIFHKSPSPGGGRGRRRAKSGPTWKGQSQSEEQSERGGEVSSLVPQSGTLSQKSLCMAGHSNHLIISNPVAGSGFGSRNQRTTTCKRACSSNFESLRRSNRKQIVMSILFNKSPGGRRGRRRTKSGPTWKGQSQSEEQSERGGRLACEKQCLGCRDFQPVRCA